MRKIVLTALLLAVSCAVSAHALFEPKFGQPYKCWSSDGSQVGTFTWTEQRRTMTHILIIWGSESFNFQNPYKANWARPFPLDPARPNSTPTIWEFTLPNVAQCTKTTVSTDRRTIFFEQCSDISTRFCLLQ